MVFIINYTLLNTIHSCFSVHANDGDSGTSLNYSIDDDDDLFRIETVDNRGHIYVTG